MNPPSYAELHAISNFSFLRSASHPEELVNRAADLGYSAIAITDECSLAGIVRAHVAAREKRIKLLVGSEFHLQESVHLVILVPDRRAYGQLCSLITLARRRSTKGSYLLGLRDLQDWQTAGCLALWLPGKEISAAELHVQTLRETFAERLWISIENHADGLEPERFRTAFALAEQYAIPLVASGGVQMHDGSRKPLLDALTAIRTGQSVQQAGRLLNQNRERHLRPRQELARLYPPALLAETLHLADLCELSLDELKYEYPMELVPEGLTPSGYLAQLVEDGASKRYPDGVPEGVRQLLDHELSLIADLGYECFFLTVHDLVLFARGRGILCQGRGSSANSAVCYCLFITEVDPARMNLLFERFISKERHEPPDIDVDFEHERREEIIQYIYRKYGRERAALAATVITYRRRSAVRDLGKALGLDIRTIDQLAKSLAWWDKKDEFSTRLTEQGIDPNSQLIHRFMALMEQLTGFPRHLSQHVGGFVISSGSLSQLVPIENAAMADRTVIQWDKDDLESLGLLKVDVLSLGMLTAIRKALNLISEWRGTKMGLADIPAEDPLTYQMLQRADSIGVFQVESRAQMSMLPRLKPASFYDLVIEIAIVRPGPIQGKMVHPYLKRRRGLEPVNYASKALRSVLERTLGVPVFQEQAIRIAVVAAGFSPGEADQLRRAMAAWKRKGGLEHFRTKLISGMLERGYDPDFAERLFEQMKGFGDYGFPESHSASFALLAYASAWLKRHEPAAFYTALLNSQPMGFYSPSQLVQDARRHGIAVLGVDVQKSFWECTLEAKADRVQRTQADTEQPAIRLGFSRVKGLGRKAADQLVSERLLQGSYRNLDDVAGKAGLHRDEMTKLAAAGAFRYLTGNRYQAYWQVQGITPETGIFALAAERAPESSNAGSPCLGEAAVDLPIPDEMDDLLADYASTGITLGRHPMAILRDLEPFRQCSRGSELASLRSGRPVQIAGLVTGRQRPGTASGVIFMTVEDETGNINVVIWQHLLERFRAPILQARLIRIKGLMERDGCVIHVIARQLEDMSSHLQGFRLKSRDFH